VCILSIIFLSIIFKDPARNFPYLVFSGTKISPRMDQLYTFLIRLADHEKQEQMVKYQPSKVKRQSSTVGIGWAGGRGAIQAAEHTHQVQNQRIDENTSEIT
jgi:hypothetical protein